MGILGLGLTIYKLMQFLIDSNSSSKIAHLKPQWLEEGALEYGNAPVYIFWYTSKNFSNLVVAR
ncbi:hypothetical protein B6N60_04815 [Richelia sinica FACHB-800]|uniref:Uncharacterized protein n=1 Tax=Richelia sinica FACHB-800 TaxID=1357546 RepID=A0A975Y796_9NOST|nr:hypothetical protein B6N60_04815 [Richelia sinica FACHB-800]